jgi:hypothetical protein
VSAAAARPGPPPLPPPDLAAQALPLHTLEAGTLLYRIHFRHHDPVHFGRSPEAGDRHRWDAPDAGYGVCYLGEADPIAFAESFLRQQPTRYLESAQLEPRSLATLCTTREVRLARMHGDGLARLGATLAVVAGPYEVCQAWSLALHRHPGSPPVDGISYRARHDDGLAVALFDRAGDTLEEVSRLALLDPQLATVLAGWLDRYALGLI